MNSNRYLCALGIGTLVAASALAISGSASADGVLRTPVDLWPGAQAQSLALSGTTGDLLAVSFIHAGGGGSAVYRAPWDQAFYQITGAQATLVTADNSGTLWAVNAQNTLYQWTGSTFRGGLTLTQCTRPIQAIGMDSGSNFWVVGCAETNDLWHHDSGGGFAASGVVPAIDVSVASDGTPWGIDPENRVWHMDAIGSNGSLQTFQDTCAFSISVTGSTSPWVVGCGVTDTHGPHPADIYQWTGNPSFTQVYAGPAYRVVGWGNFAPFFTGSDNQIYNLPENVQTVPNGSGGSGGSGSGGVPSKQ